MLLYLDIRFKAFGVVHMRDVKSLNDIPRRRGESEEVYRVKRLLVALGLRLGFKVDVEEEPESKLGSLGIRHDVVWYVDPPKWHKRLLEIVLSRDDIDPEYRKLVESKLKVRRRIYVAFEIEGGDITTKAMKGDISNLSKWPYSVIVVKRRRKEA